MAEPTEEPASTEAHTAEGRAATPSVTAVVVAHRPGAWFEETLESLVTQDYLRLELVVVDAAGEEAGADGGATLDERVEAIAPDATIIDASDTDGFAAAANTVLDTDVHSAFVLVCHDDVALAPDAVRILVTEALRSNAGVAGPKFVHWERPDRLQHVGLAVDRFATADELIEPDELDQRHHDRVRDVFAVPSACVLVRRELFATIGGFDPGISRRGEDIDLCWRAQLLGARVMVVPDATVRHREDLRARTGVDDVRRTRARHQLRTLLVVESRTRLLVTLPLLAMLSGGEILLALVTGRFGQVRDVATAWTWNLARAGAIRRRRKAFADLVSTGHRDVAGLLQSGSVRINAFVRGQIGRRDGAFGTGLTSAMRTGTTRFALIVWALVVCFVLFGSRSLIGSGVPTVGEFAAFPDSGGGLVDSLWSGWRSRDLGSPGSTPSGFGLLGLLTWATGGAIGFVRTAWVIGPVFVGLVGAWRLLGVTGSRRAQMGTLVAYAAVPLPWASLAAGAWSGLGMYAAAPWLLRSLLDAQASAPFRTAKGPVRSLVAAGTAGGVAVGLVALFDPTVAVVTVVLAAGLVAGALVAVNPTGLVRLVGGALIAMVVASVIALPFTVEQVTQGLPWHPFVGGRTPDATDVTLVDLVRFGVGPTDPGVLVWAFAIPLAVPLLIGRAWRFDLAVRLWFVALTSWALALVAVHGWVPFALPRLELLLGPAAVAVAALCGCAVSSLEHDLRGAGFGWRQVLLPLTIAASVVAVLPALGGIETGRWELPRRGYEQALPFADPRIDGSYRIVWIGAPENLPARGTALGGDTAWVATQDGLPDITEVAPVPDRGSADQVGRVLDAVVTGETSRAGRLFGGLGVRYVVTVDRLAPAPFSPEGSARPVPDALAETLDTQLDLRRVPGVNSALRVYENTEWTPIRAAAVAGFDDGVDDLFDLQVTPVRGSIGVLVGDADRLRGTVPDQTEILVAQTPDAGWRLEVDGEVAARRRALGWTTAYVPAQGGDAVLAFTTPRWRQLVVVVQLLVLVGLSAGALRRFVGASR